MAAAGTRRHRYSLLGIYLNDHLAGATGGVELARRVARSGRLPADASVPQRLAAEIAADKRALLKIMAVLGVPVRTYKPYAAWIGEKGPPG
jgi:hypothetical protein